MTRLRLLPVDRYGKERKRLCAVPGGSETKPTILPPVFVHEAGLRPTARSVNVFQLEGAGPTGWT